MKAAPKEKRIHLKKQESYALCEKQLTALLANEHDPIANMANMSALLYHQLPDVSWVGFYRHEQDELILGPFQGKPACMHIPYGKGVCGLCLKEQRLVRVDDVLQFPNHIACDSASRSEIVIPLWRHQQIFALLDIDAPIFNRFDQTDEAGLTTLGKILEQSWNQEN